jgi:hypothetical protein
MTPVTRLARCWLTLLPWSAGISAARFEDRRPLPLNKRRGSPPSHSALRGAVSFGGKSLEHYVHELSEVRRLTLEGLAARDDAWLERTQSRLTGSRIGSGRPSRRRSGNRSRNRSGNHRAVGLIGLSGPDAWQRLLVSTKLRRQGHQARAVPDAHVSPLTCAPRSRSPCARRAG